eukprot:scaffold23584_cov29-Attheya_sp.AAC.1
MSNDPDVVEFELQFRAPNVKKHFGILVYQGMEETAVAPEFFRMFINDLHRKNTETSSKTWRFSGDVTMKDLRAFYQEINKPDNPEFLFKLQNVSAFNTGLSLKVLGILLSPVYYLGGVSLSKNNLLVGLKRRFNLSKVFDQVVGKVFKSENDECRDLIGRNVPQYMTTVTPWQNIFYFLRVC